VKDSVVNHVSNPGVEAARVPLVLPADRTFGENNRGFYWKEDCPGFSRELELRRFETDDLDFIVL